MGRQSKTPGVLMLVQRIWLSLWLWMMRCLFHISTGFCPPSIILVLWIVVTTQRTSENHLGAGGFAMTKLSFLPLCRTSVTHIPTCSFMNGSSLELPHPFQCAGLSPLFSGVGSPGPSRRADVMLPLLSQASTCGGQPFMRHQRVPEKSSWCSV